MKTYQEQYKEFREKILNELKEHILKSEYVSLHTNQKAIKIDKYDMVFAVHYIELSIVNDNTIVFIDNRGYAFYKIFNFELLIDILDELKQKENE